MKIAEIVGIHNAVSTLASLNLRLPVLTALKLAEVQQLVQPIAARYDAARISRLRALGTLDEKSGMCTLSSEANAKFCSGMNMIGNTDIDLVLPRLPIHDFEPEVLDDAVSPKMDRIDPQVFLLLAPILDISLSAYQAKELEGKLEDIFAFHDEPAVCAEVSESSSDTTETQPQAVVETLPTAVPAEVKTEDTSSTESISEVPAAEAVQEAPVEAPMETAVADVPAPVQEDVVQETPVETAAVESPVESVQDVASVEGTTEPKADAVSTDAVEGAAQ